MPTVFRDLAPGRCRYFLVPRHERATPGTPCCAEPVAGGTRGLGASYCRACLPRLLKAEGAADPLSDNGRYGQPGEVPGKSPGDPRETPPAADALMLVAA